jgi:predicted dinucleotide-binding enzyme
VALTLGEELGFDVIDAGPLRNARYLEPMAELCVQLAFAQGMGTRMALRLVRS